jgi:hypothetical protein
MREENVALARREADHPLYERYAGASLISWQ